VTAAHFHGPATPAENAGPVITLSVPLTSPTKGEETLNRFYILHCIAIPLAVAMLLAIHFWRVRKDGGISGPL